MNKKIIITVVNVLLLLLIIIVVSNTRIVTQIDSQYLTDQKIDIEVLKSVIKNTKLIMYTIPITLLVVSLILMVLKKPSIIYVSLFTTVIAALLLVVNINTFDNKLLTEDMSGDNVLSPEVELVLLKINEDQYNSKGEYIENLVDILA